MLLESYLNVQAGSPIYLSSQCNSAPVPIDNSTFMFYLVFLLGGHKDVVKYTVAPEVYLEPIFTANVLDAFH